MFSIKNDLSKNCVTSDQCKDQNLYIEKDQGICQNQCPGEYLADISRKECKLGNNCILYGKFQKENNC